VRVNRRRGAKFHGPKLQAFSWVPNVCCKALILRIALDGNHFPYWLFGSQEPDMQRRNAILSLAIAAIIIVGFLMGFLYGDMGWQTSPIKRAPEQNQGGNAPADTSPAAGIKKNPQENTEMPDQQ
jgi:hypothetical protein